MAADDQSTGGSAEPEPPRPPRPFPGFETQEVAERRGGRVLRRGRRSGLAFLLLAALFVAVGVVPSAFVPGDVSEPSGRILQPKSHTSVAPDGEVRGTLADIPPDEHVWLIVRDRASVVRQASALPGRDASTYAWRELLRLRGSERVISLELYVLGREGDAFLRDRRRVDAQRARITAIPDAERLDMVRNVRVRRSR